MKNSTLKSVSYSIAGLAALVFGSSHGQTGLSIWEGIFTEDQVARGKAAYSANCASCHSGDLRGNSNTPSLLGMSFMFIWENQSLGDLYTKMREEMPSDRPASLSTQTYADLLAFLLQSNQFPVGEQELKGDIAILNQINITSNSAATP